MKRNIYFHSLVSNYYIPFIYRPSEKHYLKIITIATFLEENRLMGAAHLEMVKKDIEFMRARGCTIVKPSHIKGCHNVELEDHWFRISDSNLDRLKQVAGQDGPLGSSNL